MIDENGIIRDCYMNQLYPNLNEINSYFNVNLKEKDALGVIVKPKVLEKR